MWGSHLADLTELQGVTPVYRIGGRVGHFKAKLLQTVYSRATKTTTTSLFLSL